MKRRRQSDGRTCGKCEARRGSLSTLPPKMVGERTTSVSLADEGSAEMDDVSDTEGIAEREKGKDVEREKRRGKLVKRRAARVTMK